MVSAGSLSGHVLTPHTGERKPLIHILAGLCHSTQTGGEQSEHVRKGLVNTKLHHRSSVLGLSHVIIPKVERNATVVSSLGVSK